MHVLHTSWFTATPSRPFNPLRVADMTNQSKLKLAGAELTSRFFIGTALYPSPQVLSDAIAASGAEVVTVSLKRQLAQGADSAASNDFYAQIKASANRGNLRLLPNTAGCRTAREAVTLAQMAREVFGTNWIKLEVVGDE